MNQFDDRVREGLAEGARLPTDRAAVYSRVQELSRLYRRRRLIVQSAGCAVLGVGLLAGLVEMHGFLQGGTGEPATPAPVTAPAPAPVTAPASASPASARPGQAELDAFFGAGYHWADAEKLARLWHLDDPSQAKIEAGKRLLTGRRLPVAPG